MYLSTSLAKSAGVDKVLSTMYFTACSLLQLKEIAASVNQHKIPQMKYYIFFFYI